MVLSDEDQRSLRSNDAEKHRELAGRFQLAAATIVDALGDGLRVPWTPTQWRSQLGAERRV
jgi:hypothetical protein